MRLDRFVYEKLTNISRSAVAKQITCGHILVDNKARKPSFRVSQGQEVRGTFPPARDTRDLEAQPVDFKVIYKDSAIIVISKPPGLVVHPGAGNPGATLANGLLYRFPELRCVGTDAMRPGIVHRLDKDTSGVMVIARTPEAYEFLNRQFSERRLHKTYLAFVYGLVKQETGRIDLPISRHPDERKKMAVAREGRHAETEWRVIRRYGFVTKMEFKLLTGRTHQIRVHCAAMHHPVVGDPLYGFRRPEKAFRLDAAVRKAVVKKVRRQLLHSHSLEFLHPIARKYVKFTDPMPDDMHAFEAMLKSIQG